MAKLKLNLTNDEIIQMYQNGASLNEVAKTAGCSPDAIRTRLNKAGIEIRQFKPQTFKISDEEMKRLYEEELLSIMKIGEIAGCSRSTVSRRLSDQGVDVNFRALYTLNITKEEMIRLYVEEDKSVYEIAEIAGCKYSNISNHLSLMGIEKRPPQIEYRFDLSKEEIGDLYISGKSSKEIADMIGGSDSTVFNYLKELNIETRPAEIANRKYEIDLEFFDKIDTPEKAYILGLIYADGCSESGKKSVITLALTISDMYLLEQIRDLIYPNKDRPLYIKETKHNNGRDMAYLSISSISLVEQLQKWGVYDRKSLTLTWPDFDLGELESHFIRGYFDGDGSVMHPNRWSFIGTIDFITGLQNTLIDEIDIKRNKILHSKNHHPNTVTIQYGSKRDFLNLYMYMYKDATIYLKRKKEKFEKELPKDLVAMLQN